MGETPCGRACVVRKLGLPSQGAYLRAERPADIPRNPERIYANKGWQGWNDWLGLAAPRVPRLPWRARPGSWKPFEEARTFARSLKLPSTAAWRVFVRSDACPPDIPAQLPPDIAGTPDRVYAGGGWQGWSDWLGTPVIANFNREFLPFEEARAFVRKLGLKTAADWRDYVRSKQRPRDIPSAPYSTYKEKGWTDWADWLGTGTLRQAAESSARL